MPTTKKDHMPILEYIEAGRDLSAAIDDYWRREIAQAMVAVIASVDRPKTVEHYAWMGERPSEAPELKTGQMWMAEAARLAVANDDKTNTVLAALFDGMDPEDFHEVSMARHEHDLLASRERFAARLDRIEAALVAGGDARRAAARAPQQADRPLLGLTITTTSQAWREPTGGRTRWHVTAPQPGGMGEGPLRVRGTSPSASSLERKSSGLLFVQSLRLVTAGPHPLGSGWSRGDPRNGRSQIPEAARASRPAPDARGRGCHRDCPPLPAPTRVRQQSDRLHTDAAHRCRAGSRGTAPCRAPDPEMASRWR